MTTITAGGMPLYMAPELLNPEKFGKTNSRPTKPADMYALGMVIYEVLTGSDPFHDQNFGMIQLVCRVLDRAQPTKPGNTEKIGFGSRTWELVKGCWRTKSRRRPTIERALAHLAHISASSAVPGLTHNILHSGDTALGIGAQGTLLFTCSYLKKPHLGAKGLRRLFRPMMATIRSPSLHNLNTGNLHSPSPISHD